MSTLKEEKLNEIKDEMDNLLLEQENVSDARENKVLIDKMRALHLLKDEILCGEY